MTSRSAAYPSTHVSNNGAQASATALLAPFVRQRNVLLTTYRRDGTPVGTAVHIAVAGGRAYIRTWDATGKCKRIRANPEVTIAPSTRRGVPAPGSSQGRNRPRAGRALARKYPLLHGIAIPLTHRLRGNRTVHFELTSVSGSFRSDELAQL